MKDTNNLPTATQLRELLLYDPDSGVLTWRERPVEMFSREQDAKMWNTRFAGKRAGRVIGTRSPHYSQLRVFGRLLLAHRIIWCMQTGEWPADQIDHADGDGLNNRWANLSAVSQFENMRNGSMRSDNTSGLMGVHWRASKAIWIAQYAVNGAKRQRAFKNLLDAAAHRISINNQHFHPNHGRKS